MELRCYAIHWDDYPNTRYFLKRVRDLYHRFRRILDLERNSHLFDDLKDIEDYFKTLDDTPLLVVFSNNSSFSPDTFIAASNRRLEQHDEPWKPKYRMGPEVFVCYISIKLGGDGEKECQKVINGFFDRTECYGTECLSSFVCICDLEQGDTDTVTSIRTFVVKLIQNRTKDWTFEDLAFKERILKDQTLQERILVNSDKASPSTRISEILEGSIMVMLDKVTSYIHMLTPSIALGNLDVVEVTNDKFTDTTLGHLDQWLLISWNDLDLTFSDQSALPLQLSTAFRCVVVPFLSLKYQLPFWVCNIVTHQQLSDKSIMPLLSGNISKLKIETEKVNTDSKSSSSSNSTIGKQVLRAISEILRDISSVVPAVEKDLKSVERVTETLRKLSFEISGYYRQSSTRRDVPKPWPKLSDDLRSEILKQSNVYGTGIIYGQLEVHLEKVDHETAKEIERLVRSYGYHLPYRIRILAEHGKSHYNITLHPIKQ